MADGKENDDKFDYNKNYNKKLWNRIIIRKIELEVITMLPSLILVRSLIDNSRYS